MEPQRTIDRAISSARSDGLMPPPASEDATRDSTWLLRLGLGLTIAWVLAQLYYIFEVVGFDHFVAEGPPSVGGFLEGAFAPLAFLWLVIGFFLQREELQRSSRSIAANEQHARQEAFLRLSRLIHQQLGVRAGLLFVSSQSPAAGGPSTPEEMQSMWSALGSGDEHVFARAMMGLHFQSDEDRDSWELFWSTPIRTRHSDNFLEVFARMLDRARACDTDGLLVETLLGSTNGQLYLVIQQTRAFAPPAT
jgi:hypothetical protein